MAKGSCIVVSAEPQGRFMEGTISGTPKPGTVMEIVPDTEAVNGEFTWRATTRADDVNGAVVILREDDLQGKLATEAYENGKRGFLYAPVPGEEFNMLLRDQPGTGTAYNTKIGDLLAIDGGTGKLQGAAAGEATNARPPFTLLESIDSDLTEDTLVYVMYNG
jgi:hypothetical protein